MKAASRAGSAGSGARRRFMWRFRRREFPTGWPQILKIGLSRDQIAGDLAANSSRIESVRTGQANGALPDAVDQRREASGRLSRVGDPGEEVVVVLLEERLVEVEPGRVHGGEVAPGEVAQDDVHLADAAPHGAGFQAPEPRLVRFGH